MIYAPGGGSGTKEPKINNPIWVLKKGRDPRKLSSVRRILSIMGEILPQGCIFINRPFYL